MSKAKSRRGFAGWSEDKRKATASKGGVAVAPERRAYSVNRGLASDAGRKGGLAGKGGKKPRGPRAQVE